MHFSLLASAIGSLLILKFRGITAAGRIYTSVANNSFYVDFEHKFTWFDSQLACSQMNMSLLELSTSSKSLELEMLMKKATKQNNYTGYYLWIGGVMKQTPSHQFAWLSSGENFTYTNWYKDNPDFWNKNEFCVEILEREDWKWNDDDCLQKCGFVCEHNKIGHELIKLRETLNHQNQTHFQIKQNLQAEKEMQSAQLNREEQNLQLLQSKCRDLEHVNQETLRENKHLDAYLVAEKKAKQLLEKELKTLQELLFKQEKLVEQLKGEQKNLKDNLEAEAQKSRKLENEIQNKNNLEKELQMSKDKQIELQNSLSAATARSHRFEEELHLKRELEMQEKLKSRKNSEDELKKQNESVHELMLKLNELRKAFSQENQTHF